MDSIHVQPERLRWRSSCIVTLSLLGTLVCGVLFLTWRIWSWWADTRPFLLAEHRAWPKPTPPSRLATTSPGGTFVTLSRKHGGDGLSSHSETHDCIYVARASCRTNALEFSWQDRARCEHTWWLCRWGDGNLLHERFRVSFRWLDDTHIEETWTELIGLDKSGHRIWGRKTKILRISATPRTDGLQLSDCDRIEINANVIKTKQE